MYLRNIIVGVAAWAYDGPLRAILLVVGLSAILAFGLKDLRIDSSNEELFQKDDPVLERFHRFQRQFGRDDIVVVALSSDKIFTAEFMRQLKAFHADLESTVPWLDDVTSLVNVDWMAATSDGELKINELGREWPLEGALGKDLQQDILSSSLYKDTLISQDGTMTLVIVRALAFVSPEVADASPSEDFFQDMTNDPIKPQQLSAAENNHVSKGLSEQHLNAFVMAIGEVVEKHRLSGLEIRLTGGPLLDKLHHDAIHDDTSQLILLALLVIFIALYILFKTKTAVILPFVVIVLCLISVLGFMGWVDLPMTVVSQALPPIILMCGVLDSIHLLGLYYIRQQTQSPRDAILQAVNHSGMAVIFTSLTTAAGFLSFTVARLKPISDFGWLASLGVMLALVYTLVLLPALIRLHQGGSQQVIHSRFWQNSTRYLERIAAVGIRYPRHVLFIVVILVVAGIPGVSKIYFSYDVLRWFPEDAPIRVDTLAIDSKVKATVPLEVIIDTGKKNGIVTTDFMQRLRHFQDYVEALPADPVSVGRATSIVDVIERIHTQLSSLESVSLPTTENLLHQEMLLYESAGAREISRLVDTNYSMARITLRLAWADGRDMVKIRDAVQIKAKEVFSEVGNVDVTGSVDLVSSSIMDVISSMLASYTFAATTISLMLIFLWRSIRLGLIAMLPNFFTIYIGLALMGYAGMPLDMFTVLLGGIALGLAVDDTVHLFNGIQQRVNDSQTVIVAVGNTIREIGPTLLLTTCVLAGGFSMFGFSMMSALSKFGVLLMTVMLFALLVDLLVVPALAIFAGSAWLRSKSIPIIKEDVPV